MSKTDNTRPWKIQAEDLTNPGFYEWSAWDGNLQRIPHHTGGERYAGGNFKEERKLRQRSIRARQRQELVRVSRAYPDDRDFDMKVIRKDVSSVLEDVLMNQ